MQKKIAVVSGGVGDIGSEITVCFARAGFEVFVLDVRKPSKKLVSRCSSTIGMTRFVQIDVTNLDEVVDFFDSTFEIDSHIDTIVNNVGVPGPKGPIDQIDLAELNELFRTNVFSYFYICNKAVPFLKRAQYPSIINIGSVAGVMGYKNRSAYSSSKWAVTGLTKSLSLELGEFNIRVNSISPGAVKGTPLKTAIENRANDLGVSTHDVEKEYLVQSSMLKLVEPIDIATQALFLASAESRYITGQNICVDAGTYFLK